ncbi:AI-2E family transporter [Lactobacillus crispatus]|uniref:AI-2E family transporter n=1 Tax=Lactobacillus crispatus TaxID=47770 RepID=UPI0022ABF3E9|nr:AI-2E family transporter [Lactobacillus crispatus]MCZ3522825.1 AI-2E family transporter [Lactobacillus crispatus]MCZ3524880.1 AI-2E family transporter [Lactobacillus crispatus]MCZ3528798.1 AI-2E family transporter [Lactobacillus crispatus]MCZ3535768.1 AI-2E family transporter [Lactobacillus crispatus]
MDTAWQKFKNNIPLRRFVVLLLIIACLYEIRAMMNTVLLTFIFTYVIVHLIHLVQRYFPKIPTGLIVAVTYLIILALLYFVVTIYLPMLVGQISKMVKSVMAFYESNESSRLASHVTRYISKGEIVTQANRVGTFALHTVTNFGSLTIATFMSLILSFFYTIELDRMIEFSKLFVKSGYFKWLFEDIRYFGKKFTNTFGVVLEAQFFIAICNTALTMIGLAFMHMPQIIALGLMVFILSLVPVAGVIISLIPLSIIGYSVGGIRYVIYIFIMIMIIHAIEAYVLNPKFMASKTEVPIFYTFLVLLVAEHFWGTWGLIVGVPIFTFLLDVLGIKSAKKSKKKANK